MARKIGEMQKKFQIIEKLTDLGITTEEQLKNITPDDLIKNEKFSFHELNLIYSLQESVKNSKVYSFLTLKGEI